MSVNVEANATLRERAPGLLARLRVETALLHDDVERSTDLPHSIHTISQYLELLCLFHQLHFGFECRLGAARFADLWTAHGVNLPDHIRTAQLAADIAALNSRPPAVALGVPDLQNFGQALGCLYVLEGSSLGGKVLARAISEFLPGVPTAFLEGHGRGHPRPWRVLSPYCRRRRRTSPTTPSSERD